MEISNLASLLTLYEARDTADRTDVYFHSCVTYLLLHITCANQKNRITEETGNAIIKTSGVD